MALQDRLLVYSIMDKGVLAAYTTKNLDDAIIPLFLGSDFTEDHKAQLLLVQASSKARNHCFQFYGGFESVNDLFNRIPADSLKDPMTMHELVGSINPPSDICLVIKEHYLELEKEKSLNFFVEQGILQ